MKARQAGKSDPGRGMDGRRHSPFGRILFSEFLFLRPPPVPPLHPPSTTVHLGIPSSTTCSDPPHQLASHSCHRKHPRRLLICPPAAGHSITLSTSKTQGETQTETRPWALFASLLVGCQTAPPPGTVSLNTRLTALCRGRLVLATATTKKAVQSATSSQMLGLP